MKSKEPNRSEGGEPENIENMELETPRTPSTIESTADSSPSTTTTTTTPTSSVSFGGWFSSIVQTAKDTVNMSAGTIENIKRDLSEFKDSVQSDATTMVYSTASIVKTKLNEIGNTVNEIGSLGTGDDDEASLVVVDDQEPKQKSKIMTTTTTTTNEEDKSENKLEKIKEPNDEDQDEAPELPSFNLAALESWTNMFADRAKSTISKVKDSLVDSIFGEFPEDDDDDDNDDPNGGGPQPYVLRRGRFIPIPDWKAKLHTVQIDPNTFCREASGAPEDYETWLAAFNLFNYRKRMQRLLETVPEIAALHRDLVPTELSDSDFWHRYYYKVHQLREAEKRLILDAPEDEIAPDESVANRLNRSPDRIEEIESPLESSSKSASSSGSDWEKLSASAAAVEEKEKRSADSKVAATTTAASSKLTRKKKANKKANSIDEEKDWVKCD